MLSQQVDLWPDQPFVLIGMVHLLPLPGSPNYCGNLDIIIERAVSDAEVLTSGGMDAIMIENFGDSPFFPDSVPPSTVAHISRIVAEIRNKVTVPIGVNVLRNDGIAAISIASANQCDFVRINVLSGARWTDQGLVQGKAHQVLRERAMMNSQISIFADVDVKHSYPVANESLTQTTHDLVERGGADGLIVSGSGTGESINLTDLGTVHEAAGNRPVWIGSGFHANQLPDVGRLARGAIVGTSIKVEGQVLEPVCATRVQELVKARDAAV